MNLDQALSDITALRDALTELSAQPRLTPGVGSLVVRAVVRLDDAHDLLTRAIAIDDAAHPEG